MESNELPKSDKIMVWGHRDAEHYQPDEALIPPGKDPSVHDEETGMNLRETYDARWQPE
jgi:hypothetical protein